MKFKKPKLFYKYKPHKPNKAQLYWEVRAWRFTTFMLNRVIKQHLETETIHTTEDYT